MQKMKIAFKRRVSKMRHCLKMKKSENRQKLKNFIDKAISLLKNVQKIKNISNFKIPRTKQAEKRILAM